MINTLKNTIVLISFILCFTSCDKGFQSVEDSQQEGDSQPVEDKKNYRYYFEYIEYVGTLSVSGNYYNVNVDGTTTAIGSLQYIDAAAHPAAVNGAKIKVRGYFIGVSSSKYVNTMTVSVEAAE